MSSTESDDDVRGPGSEQRPPHPPAMVVLGSASTAASAIYALSSLGVLQASLLAAASYFLVMELIGKTADGGGVSHSPSTSAKRKLTRREVRQNGGLVRPRQTEDLASDEEDGEVNEGEIKDRAMCINMLT